MSTRHQCEASMWRHEADTWQQSSEVDAVAADVVAAGTDAWYW